MPARTIGHHVIQYEEAGQGDALILLHGFPLDSRIWTAQRRSLSDAFRVITPDLPGFGKSTSADAFTLASQAQTMHAFLKEIGALPCVLGGLSMGGYIALEFVKKYPTDLSGLALIDTRAEGDSPQGKAAREQMIQLVREKGSKAVAGQMMPKLLAPGAEKARPAVVRELQEIMENCPPLTIEHALCAMRDRADHTENLPSIPAQTLVIVGEADAITPVETARKMQQAIAKSELIVIRGAGHMSPMEQPEQVNAALRRFARRQV